ncbi:SEC-C metal-binding domain-containing protein [Poriferisphaera corsica]
MSYGRVEFKYKGSHIGEGRKRNKPCECGSGKKYKKCCWNKKASE